MPTFPTSSSSPSTLPAIFWKGHAAIRWTGPTNRSWGPAFGSWEKPNTHPWTRVAIRETIVFLKSHQQWSNPLMRSLFGEKTGADEFQAVKSAARARLEAQQAEAEAALADTIVFADARRQGFRDWFASGEAFTEASKVTAVSFDFTTPLRAHEVQPANPARSGGLMP